MPKARLPAAPVKLCHGEDDLTVKQQARRTYQEWCDALGGEDHEIINAASANSGEALRALAQLREALNTLPFFGTGKVVWLQDCSFLADERTATAQSVEEALAALARELISFDWQNVRLLINAIKVDKRRVLYKTLEKIATVEYYPGFSAEDRDWAARAEAMALRLLDELGKTISPEAAAELIGAVGPHIRQLHNEIEKLSLFVGDRPAIETNDVTAVVTRNKQARAFALGDALGDRDLPRLLRALDDELWEARGDRQKSGIGLLYGLILKVRTLILTKELLRLGYLKPEINYQRFKAQLAGLPSEALPRDKRFNPLSLNAYVLFKALPQTRRYQMEELTQAMEWLLECNHQLVSSRLEESLALQRTLIRIVNQTVPPAMERRRVDSRIPA